MAYRLNAASRANRQLCRLNRAPVLAAELATIFADSRINQTPVVTVALGDLVHAETFTPLGNPAMRAPLAKAVSLFYKDQKPNLTAIQVKAIMYSEMTMSCTGQASGTIAEMEEARNKLKAILRAKPPTDAEVQAVFTGCWNKLYVLGAESKYRIQDVSGLAQAIDAYSTLTEVNQRAFQAWAHGCGVFSPDLVRPASASRAWRNVSSIMYPDNLRGGCDMTVPEAEMATISIDYDQFLKKWKVGTLQFLCAFYDAQAWVDKATVEKDIVHALFTCLAHLSKGQNKTTTWINARFRRVQEHIVGLGDLDATVVQEFCKMHGGLKLSSEQIFAVLAASYKCLEEKPAASLCWVIEQSVASNITGALIVADIITKLQFFPLSTIIDKVIPEIEFRALVRLALHTIVSKFGSLAGPTVRVREYADIAHLALAIYKRSLRGSERNSLIRIDYAGEYTQFLRLNKNDLEAMASNIQAISVGSAASSVSLTNLIRNEVGSGAIIAEMNGEAMVFEDLGPTTQDEDETSLHQPQGAVPLVHLPAELRRHKRFYKAKNVQATLAELRERESEKIKAFRFIMGELSTCGVRSSAHIADMLLRKYRLPYTLITSELETMFKLWLGDEVDRYLQEHAGDMVEDNGLLPAYYVGYVANIANVEPGPA